MYQPFYCSLHQNWKFHWYSPNRKIQFQNKKLHLMHLKKLHLSFTLFPIIFGLSEPKAQYNPILTFQIINHFVCITTWQFSNLLVILRNIQGSTDSIQKTSWGHLTNCYSQTKNQLNQPYYHISYINRTIDRKSLIQTFNIFSRKIKQIAAQLSQLFCTYFLNINFNTTRIFVPLWVRNKNVPLFSHQNFKEKTEHINYKKHYVKKSKITF